MCTVPHTHTYPGLAFDLTPVHCLPQIRDPLLTPVHSPPRTMDRVLRRQLRSAVHSRDVTRLKALTRAGDNVNCVLSKRNQDTVGLVLYSSVWKLHSRMTHPRRVAS